VRRPSTKLDISVFTVFKKWNSLSAVVRRQAPASGHAPEIDGQGLGASPGDKGRKGQEQGGTWVGGVGLQTRRLPRRIGRSFGREAEARPSTHGKRLVHISLEGQILSRLVLSFAISGAGRANDKTCPEAKARTNAQVSADGCRRQRPSYDALAAGVSPRAPEWVL
jgi:hypothetical protein